MVNRKYSYNFFVNLPERLYPNYLKKFYKEEMGERLDIKSPKKLSEKIQWLKLNDNTSLKSRLTDKLEVRNYIKEKNLNINFAEVYTSGKSFEELDFSKCPESFVIKTNHFCRNSTLITNKNNFLQNTDYFEYIKDLYNDNLNKNYAYSSGFEMHYKNIEPKVFVEEYINNDENVGGYFEYRFLYLNGKLAFIDTIHLHKSSLFDKDWNKLNISYADYPSLDDNIIKKPIHFEEMKEYSEILAKDFKLIRVDFFEYKGNLYLSELTFTPFSGFIKFIPEKYDYEFGKMLQLN